MSQIEYDFSSSLNEVNELLLLAEGQSADNQRLVAALNKAALILLAAKFESFLENLVETYVYMISQSDISRDKLPTKIRYHHFLKILSPIIENNNLSTEKLEVICRNIAEFFTGNQIELKINTRFNYGKHGSSEVEKLLGKIGISDIFGVFMCVNQRIESEIDIAGDINSMTSIRNNIIHGDADPALSTDQVRGYVKKIELWSNCLNDVLNIELNTILNN